jgi:protein-tyrosine kinase
MTQVMDLRRSIEKAKKSRQQKQPTKKDSPPAGKKRELSKWKAPVYHNSCRLDLNPEKAHKNRCFCLSADGPEMGYYKHLRTQIQQRCKANNWNTMMITSVLPGEGKTLTAINLALTFAREFNQTVLLVDCDLKRQRVHEYLGIESDKGIGHYLTNGTPLKDVITWPGIEKFTLISGGDPVAESTELLSSPKMKSLVAEMKHRYPDRYILFDMPPLLSVADAAAFAPMVDCILIVVQADRTNIMDIHKALDLIPNEKFLGFVLNRHKSFPKRHSKYF